MTTPRSLKTPRIFEPEPLSASDECLEHFVTAQSDVLELLDTYGDADWKKTRTSSPASSLMRLNLGDCFVILADHGDRHVNQLKRQRSAVVDT